MKVPQPSSKYEGKRRKVYMCEWLHAALMELANINRDEGREGRSFSALLVRAGIAIVRRPSNAARLRNAGIALPASIFRKEAE